MKSLALLVALLLAAQPLAAMSQQGGGGRPAGGGGARPSGGAQRPAQAPAKGSGYNLNRDVNASRPAQPQTRPAQPQTRPAQPQTRPAQPQTRPAQPQNRPNTPQQQPNRGNVNNVNTGNKNTVNVNRNYYNNTGYHGVVVVNPRYRGPAWGWNRGVAWYPAPAYWGGGFWGPFAIGVTSVALYGAIVANNQRYVSYQVQPTSPGATMLSNYQLRQTPCGPPNLVVVYGPNNSVICAYPNNLVSAGNYSLDTSNLSLVSQ